MMSYEFKKWNDLNQFHEVIKTVDRNKFAQEYLKANNYKIRYEKKIKLHGTNAGICLFKDGTVKAMKRSSYIDVNSDNAGFAKWVDGLQIAIAIPNPLEAIRIYGEWAGPGVQSGVAVSQISEKQFFIFAADFEYEDGYVERIYRPDWLEFLLDRFVSGIIENNRVKILPLHGDDIIIDFKDVDQTTRAITQLNQEVEEIGKLDPYIKEEFDIEGAGEGLVLYPSDLGG